MATEKRQSARGGIFLLAMALGLCMVVAVVCMRDATIIPAPPRRIVMFFRRLPIISGFYELQPSARRFLTFNTINIISWQCLIGEILVLFGREINMPTSWVGVLMSILPLSQILVIFTVPLVERFGPRRMLMSVWIARNTMGMSVFAMPWAMAHWGQEAGWYVLMFATLSFCVTRALGIGGWFPWIHEVVERDQQGVFFSTETSLVLLINIFVAFGTAKFLAIAGQPEGFYVIYGFGLCVGFASVLAMRAIPGGRATPATRHTRRNTWDVYREALRDRAFMHYALVMVLGMFAWGWFGAANILYMRDALQFSSPHILYLKGAGCIAAVFTLRYWGRYADRHGSVPALMYTLGVHAVVAPAWLLLVPGGGWNDYLAIPLVALSLIFLPASQSIAVRGMLARLGPQARFGYSNIWVCLSALCNGVAPILAGQVISRGNLLGFRACFIISSVLTVLVVALLRSVPQETGKPEMQGVGNILNPALPFRTLGRIVWVTLGLEERRAQNEESGSSGK